MNKIKDHILKKSNLEINSFSLKGGFEIDNFYKTQI